MPRSNLTRAVVLALFVSLAMSGASYAGVADAAEGFVADARCVECHRAEFEAWRGSDHDRAMAEPTEATVLGDFSAATFEYAGTTTKFSRRGEKFVVTTDGPDGKPANFDVAYVFGVAPLQQYLLALPGGRLQALSIAWDVPGKRWFHLYPDERVDFRDELHWTKPAQNWNFMCAECHSTNVEKRYERATDRYATSWLEIDVGCQACHGPGAAHVESAVARRDGKSPAVDTKPVGLPVVFGGTESRVEVEHCARCHARRSVIAPDYEYGKRLMDTHLPALLDEDLYYADGQILGEVYEYGSFLQSKMAEKGLRCSDCHDAHSSKLTAAGDALCVTCHNAGEPAARAGIDTSGLSKKNYASAEHHFHKEGGPGSRCVECHAPKTTYMVVDPRVDHSFRIPRPDLSATTGSPDACTRCHSEKGPDWAASVLRDRAAPATRGTHYGVALAAGRSGKAGAMRALTRLAGDAAAPAIARATALELLAAYPGEGALRAVLAGLKNTDPLVRRAAVTGLPMLPARERVVVLVPVLDDPVLAVRIEAARLLAPAGESALPPDRVPAYRVALGELEASYRANDDRGEARLGEANLLAQLGRYDEAETVYRSALAFDPLPVTAVVNLADLLRARGKEAESEKVVRDGLAKLPGDPTLQYVLALSAVRQGRKQEGLALLAEAAKAAPDRTQIVYTYAVALADAGDLKQAIEVLKKALAASRGSRDVLLALAAFERDAGNTEAASGYIEELRAINPDDPALRQMGQLGSE